MKRIFIAITAALAIFLAVPALAGGLELIPGGRGGQQGQPLLVRACIKAKGQAYISFLGRPVAVIKDKSGCLVAALAPDLTTRPGKYSVRLKSGRRTIARAGLMVAARDYGTRRITVNPKFMRLSARQLARHKKEYARQLAVYASRSPRRLWRGGFLHPVPGIQVGQFGRKSIINGKPRSPHGGQDLRAAKGEPVHAPAAGRVALVDDTFFGGLIVMLDHGQGIISAYRHLSKAEVKAGDMVRKGQEIGRAGSSGRVTGPHLHYDIHLAGSRVDPVAWAKLSKRLARMLGDKP